ncbi:hypothetical protein GC197_13790 [bacterium]|nr:hypothetical protein [bacterium]
MHVLRIRFAATLCLAMGLLLSGCWQYSEHIRIVQSKETTYFITDSKDVAQITYGQLLDEKWRQRASEGKNSAIPLLLATWPFESNDTNHELVRSVLGGFEIPQHNEDLLGRSLIDEVIDWLEQQHPVEVRAPGQNCIPSLAVLAARLAPWQPEQFPPLAHWIERENDRLDILNQMLECPEFYCPDPIRLGKEPKTIRESSRFCSEQIERAAAALEIRAMSSIARGKTEEAWKDIRTVYTLSALGNWRNTGDAEASFLVRRQAFHATTVLISHGECDSEMLSQIDAFLASLPNHRRILVDVILYQRLVTISSFLDFYLRGDAKQDAVLDVDLIRQVEINPNEALIGINQWFDEVDLLTASNQEDVTAQAYSAETYLDRARRRLVSAQRLQSEGLAERSRVLGDEFFSQSTVANNICSWMMYCESLDVHRDLLRHAIELERFKCQHGDYPTTLNEIAGESSSEKFEDPYSDVLLSYSRRDSGYCLYSIGFDRKDNGGNSGDATVGFIRDGNWQEGVMPDGEESGMDIVVRVPVPLFKACHSRAPASTTEAL